MESDEESIFEEALSFEDPIERDRYLNRACYNNPVLKSRVSALLKSYVTSDFLDGTPDRVNSLINEDRTHGLVNCRFGPYLALELIGEGGMGLVFLAQDLESVDHPRVAIKVIKPGLDSRQVWDRFQLEQEALQRLSHPNISKFLGSGLVDVRFAYIAMELIQGISITRYCDRERLSIEDRIKLLIDTCLAVDYAHVHGIVHRDLKPENILITVKQDKPLVKVIDFGVAKAVFGAKFQTQPSTRALQFIGTPQYMSPEQMRWSSDVDERTDIYSLGVLLCELLTGETPKQSDGDLVLPMELSTVQESSYSNLPSALLRTRSKEELDTVSEKRALQPSQLTQIVRGDLDWIAAKATEANRNDRYRTAKELAEDLQRYLDHRPILARPPKLITRLSKLSHRYQLKSTKAISLLMVILTLAGLLSAAIAIRHDRYLRTKLASEKAEAEVDATHQQFVHELQMAGEHIHSGGWQTMTKTLDNWVQPGSRFRDHFVLNYVRSLASEPIQSLQAHQQDVLDMDLSQDERWIASCDKGGEIVIWDAKLGAELHKLKFNDQEVTQVGFSPDSRILATAGQDQIVRLIDVEDWRLMAELTGHERTINGLDWSPDGKWLVSGARDGVVRVWDISQRACVQVLPTHQEPVRCLKWSPDGKWLATAEGGIGVHIWSTETWKEHHLIQTNGNGALAIAFSRDSYFVALGGYGGELLIVDTNGFVERQRSVLSHQIKSLVFGDLQQLLVGGMTGEVDLFQYSNPLQQWVPARQETNSLIKGSVCSFAINTSDDRIYVQSSQDRTLFILSHDAFVGCGTTKHLPIPVGVVADSKLVLLSDEKGLNASFCNASTGNVEWSISNRVNHRCRPLYSASRDMVCVACFASENSEVLLFHRSTGELAANLPFSGVLHGLSMSRDSKYLVGAGWNGKGQIRVWNLHTLEALDLPYGYGEFEAAAQFSPNEDLLVVGPAGTRKLTCLQSGTWKKIRDAETSTTWGTFLFAETGKRLIVGETNRISVWDSDLKLRQWSSAFDDNGRREKVFSLALTPDESTIVGYSGQTSIRFWDFRSRSELFSHNIPRGAAGLLHFPNPNTLHVHAIDVWYVLSGKTSL